MNKSYIFQSESAAKVYGRNLSISTKKSVEICRELQGKSLERGKRILDQVIKKTQPLAMKRYIRDTPHRKGIGPGRYPVNSSKAILKLLQSAEANAQNKGLSTKDLVIYHASAHKASKPWHFGRLRGRKMKRTHVQIILKEKKSTSEKSGDKK